MLGSILDFLKNFIVVGSSSKEYAKKLRSIGFGSRFIFGNDDSWFDGFSFFQNPQVLLRGGSRCEKLGKHLVHGL
jgi:hypothetical protein